MRNKRYDFIRFIAILMIVIFHYNVTLANNNIIETNIFLKGGIINLGSVGVGLFFILSGANLYNKYKDKLDIKNFYKKRLLKLYIPLWISYILLFIIMVCFNKNLLKYNKFHLLFSMLGLDLLYPAFEKFLHIYPLWIVGEWFTTVIIIIYILFPLLRYLREKNKMLTTIIICIITLINIKFKILSFENGFYSITNGIMYFYLGMILNDNKNKLTSSYTIILAFFGIVMSEIFKIYDIYGFWYIFCFIFNVSLFILLYQINYSNILTKFICKYNYEIYLIHHRIFILFIPIILMKKSSPLLIFLTFFILFLIIYFLSMTTQFITNKILVSKKEA